MNLARQQHQASVASYHSGESTYRYGCLASLEDIQKNGFDLNILRYVDRFEEEEINLAEAIDEREALNGRLSEIESKMSQSPQELGYAS